MDLAVRFVGGREIGVRAMKRRCVYAAIFAITLGVFGSPQAGAQEGSTQGSQPPNQPPTQGSQLQNQPPPSPWSFRISPYVWFAGLKGHVDVNGNLPPLDVDVDFSVIFHAIDWF